MNEEKFNNYKFCINTELKLNGEWHKIFEVNFEEGRIGVESGHYLKYSEFEDIRN